MSALFTERALYELPVHSDAHCDDDQRKSLIVFVSAIGMENSPGVPPWIARLAVEGNQAGVLTGSSFGGQW